MSNGPIRLLFFQDHAGLICQGAYYLSWKFSILSCAILQSLNPPISHV